MPLPRQVRLYSVLFTPEDPEATAKAAAGSEAAAAAEDDEDDEDDEEEEAGAAALPAWLKLVNPDSLQVAHALIEPALRASCAPASGHSRATFQFQRTGYFCVDNSSSVDKPVFNRVVALKEDKEAKAVKA